MNEATILKRDFNTTDSYMVVTARAIYNLFNANLSDFTDFDSTLDTAFAATFLTALLAAEGLISDNVVIDQVAEKTENVENVMIEARNKYTEMKYFAQKAFTSKPILNQFGLNDYEEARKNPGRMLTFLTELHTTATQYQTNLVGVGCDASKIAAILTVYAALLAATEAQSDAMRTRPVTTQDRIVILNTCYVRMTEVNAAAQLVYADDAARQGQYVFESTSNAFDGPGVYDGIIAGGASIQVVHIHYKSDRTLVFENTGTTELKFWLNGGGLGTQGNVITLAASQKSADLTMADLDATGNHVIVQNTNADTAGNYKVTVGKY